MLHPLVQPQPIRYLALDVSEYYPRIGTVRMRSLSAKEKASFELGNRAKHLSEEWCQAEITRQCELLCLVVVGEDDRLALSLTDALQLAENDGRLIEMLYQAACRHVGLVLDKSIYEAIAVAEKKSLTTGSSSSPSN